MRLYQKPCARVNSRFEDFEVEKLEFKNSHYGDVLRLYKVMRKSAVKFYVEFYFTLRVSFRQSISLVMENCPGFESPANDKKT